MRADLPRSTRRVHDALVALGLPADIHRMADSTRTAPEAAAAVGCGLRDRPGRARHGG